LNNKADIVYFIGEIGLGGTEKQVTLLLKYLKKNNFNYHIFIFNKSIFGDFKNELIETGVQLYFIPDRFRSIIARLIYLLGHLRKIKPIIIHSWTVHNNAYAGLLGLLLNIPMTIGSVRGSLNGTSFKRLPYLLKWFSLKSVNALVVNSKSIKKELINFSVDRNDIIIIPNCVELQNSVRKLDNENELIVCTIGNLRENKNQTLFIKVMSRVIEAIPHAKGWIIGQPVKDSPLVENRLNNQIQTLGLIGKVKVLGFKSNTIKYLKQSSIFMLPSLSEGVPNTVLEAMSIGIPVIASRVGGLPEIITHKANGFLYDPDDEDGFINCLFNLLYDAKYSDHVGTNGFNYINRKHNPSVIAKELDKLYSGKDIDAI